MKAMILAAGQGKRLRPLTDDRPKCMVEYQGRPLLHYTLEVLRSCGIENICVLGGYRASSLAANGARVTLNPDFESTNMVYTMFRGEAELDDDIIIAYGDIIFRQDVLQQLLYTPGDFCVVVDQRWEELWRQRMEDPLMDAETMKLDDRGRILELGKKPTSLLEIHGQYIGLMKISKRGLGVVREFYRGLDRTLTYDGATFEMMYMTTFIQKIIDEVMPVRAVLIQGGWLEVDCPSDLKCTMV
jgi:choline kinase